MSSQQNNRRIFRIEVGNIPDSAIQDYMQKLKDSFKRQVLLPSFSIEPSNNIYKRELLIERTGYINFKYNPMVIQEDYFLPLR